MRNPIDERRGREVGLGLRAGLGLAALLAAFAGCNTPKDDDDPAPQGSAATALSSARPIATDQSPRTLAPPALPPPAAEPATYDIDPSFSHVGFSVRHLGVSSLRGEFRKFSGTAFVDEKNPSASKVNLQIDAASIETGDAKRDEHLRGPEFLEAAKFAKIEFVSTSAERKASGWSLGGQLTMHGVTKPVFLDLVPLSAPVKDSAGVSHRGTHGHGKLNRKEFGLGWNQTLESGTVFAGDDVLLDLDVELVQRASPKGG